MSLPKITEQAAEVLAHNEVTQETSLALCLENVSKIYRLYGNPRDQVIDILGLNRLLPWRRGRSFQEFHALKCVDLKIRHGERVGIIGRNGAGKTTLLKLITGNFAPTSGRVAVYGTVQALMQTGVGFHPEFSGYENIRAALIYNGLVGSAFDEALADVIDFVELGEFLHQPLKTYSLGMGARVQFAAATAIQPDIMIIDEVMGAGDAYFTGKSAHRMEKLTSSGCTLLLVSHSTPQVLQFCDHVIWIEKGEIRMQGKTIEVVKAYEEFTERLGRRKLEHAKSTELSSSIGREPEGSSEKEMGAGEQKDFSTAEWQKDKMMALLDFAAPPDVQSNSEGGISRWPAEQGLKIVRVGVLDEHGTVTTSIRSGRPLDIEIEFVAEHGGDFECRFIILLITIDGRPLTRHISDEFVFKLVQGDRRTVHLHYDETLLADGEFVFSAAIYKVFDPDDLSSAVRYDLLSRSFKLHILPQPTSFTTLFVHPATWRLGRATEPGRP